jgi:hypothetical protein
MAVRRPATRTSRDKDFACPSGTHRGKDIVFVCTVVAQELNLSLVLSPERRVPVSARFVYRAADPFAVHVAFHTDAQAPIHWTFARDLLFEGKYRWSVVIGSGSVPLSTGAGRGSGRSRRREW